MGELRVNTLAAENGTDPVDLTGQSATKVFCRWVGTGTPTVNESLNVSSITDVGVGQQTPNFTNAMENANFGFTGMSNQYHTVNNGGSVSALACLTANSTHAAADANRVAVAIYGDLA